MRDLAFAAHRLTGIRASCLQKHKNRKKRPINCEQALLVRVPNPRNQRDAAQPLGDIKAGGTDTVHELEHSVVDVLVYQQWQVLAGMPLHDPDLTQQLQQVQLTRGCVLGQEKHRLFERLTILLT